MRVAHGLQQTLPANGAKHHVDQRRGDRGGDEPGIRFLDLAPDLVEVRAAKKKEKQARRKKNENKGPNLFPHAN